MEEEEVENGHIQNEKALFDKILICSLEAVKILEDVILPTKVH